MQVRAEEDAKVRNGGMHHCLHRAPRGDGAVREYSRKFDQWDPATLVCPRLKSTRRARACPRGRSRTSHLPRSSRQLRADPARLDEGRGCRRRRHPRPQAPSVNAVGAASPAASTHRSRRRYIWAMLTLRWRVSGAWCPPLRRSETNSPAIVTAMRGGGSRARRRAGGRGDGGTQTCAGGPLVRTGQHVRRRSKKRQLF